MLPRPTQKEKTQRAFQAYLDLLNAAEWFKAQMRAPLESFDLTMEGFRLLTVLYREGALPIAEVARRRGCSIQNMHAVIARLAGAPVGGAGDRESSARGDCGKPLAGGAARQAKKGADDCGGGPDEAGQEVYRAGPAEAFEDGEGVDEGDHRTPAKNSERDLPATASRRHREICEGDQDAGGGGLRKVKSLGLRVESRLAHRANLVGARKDSEVIRSRPLRCAGHPPALTRWRPRSTD
jgi:hypothetical protein